MNTLTDNQISKLCNADMLCVDIETKDPDLRTHGAGTHRGEGFVCGVGFGAVVEGEEIASYLPIKHRDAQDVDRNKRVIQVLLDSHTPKLGTNIVYDFEWLEHENYTINKDQGVHDICTAEPLLDEYRRRYGLDALAKTYSDKEKRTDILKDYTKMMGWKGKPASHIWRMPSETVSEYVIGDVTLPLEIFAKQKEKLEREKLWDLYKMEMDLLPSMLHMRRNGVRLDIKKLGSTVQAFTEKHYSLKRDIFAWAGREINLNSSQQLAAVFDDKGIPYPLRPPTEKMIRDGKKGNPQLDKAALSKMSAFFPICKTISEYRHYDTMINMFFLPYLDFEVDGRLYGSFHPLRADDYGTVAGRFSASKPNLQQVSAIDEDGGEGDNEIKGQVLRELFIPEEGKLWAKLDYSQVEYRIMMHYASGSEAEELRARYNNDPTTDMHQIICDLTGFDRRTAKRLNFGGAYGMGVATAAELFGWTMDEAQAFMSSYHRAAPYVKSLRNSVSKAAQRRGFIFTLLGRKARTHPSRKLHSMFNRLIQGSAADVMKKGMVDAEKAGLFDTLDLHLTVHDEMDVSYTDNPEGRDAIKELQHVMETAVDISVPLLVDCHTGMNWAEAD